MSNKLEMVKLYKMIDVIKMPYVSVQYWYIKSVYEILNVKRVKQCQDKEKKLT